MSRHVNIRHGRITVRLANGSDPGRYVVTITVSSGRRHAILLRQPITVRPAR